MYVKKKIRKRRTKKEDIYESERRPQLVFNIKTQKKRKNKIK
jgi:hypothetical protein